MSATAPRPSVAAARPRRLGALRHRNYRLFFCGQLVSTVGTWMQSIAQPWLVLQLTHSGLLVGLTLAAQFLPMLVAGPFGGVVADRFPKRRVLQVTQAAFIVPACFLFVTTYLHVTTYPMVMAAALGWGIIQVVDAPTRQAFAIEMVGREDLMNAIALNSAIWNGAAVLGPSIAGLLIAVVGLPICFILNAVSYGAVIAALALMRNLPSLVSSESLPMLGRISEGARYIRCDPLVLSLLMVTATFSLFAMNRLTLIPLFSEQVLHQGAVGFGLLMGAQGLGALTGALTLACLARARASGRHLFWIGLAWAALLQVFSVSTAFLLSMVLLYVSGITQMWFMTAVNTRIQKATPDRLRGRVMAFYAQSVMGTGPIGATLAGALASLLGPPAAMAIGASMAGAVLITVRLASPAAFTFEPDALASPSAC